MTTFNIITFNAYAKCHYAECRYAKCHCAECRGAEGALSATISLPVPVAGFKPSILELSVESSTTILIVKTQVTVREREQGTF
jgi:hypothetical protein